MEIKFGGIKITAPYEKYLLKHITESPFDSRHTQDFTDNLFKRAPIEYANYFEEYKKFMEKLIKLSKAGKSEE